MDMAKLHEPYKGKESPSIEGQKNWLRKRGFKQPQIDKAMLTLYADMARGATPLVFEGSKEVTRKEIKYGMADSKPPSGFEARPVKTGAELDQSLLVYATFFKAEDDAQETQQAQEFYKMLEKRWLKQVPWYKRLFGIRPKEKAE
jgi:hypothetical protein